MYSFSGGSTEAFSDNAELEDRIQKTQAEYRQNDAPAQQAHPWLLKLESKKTPGKLEAPELIEAFKNAFLTSLPDARIILASSCRPNGADSAIIPLPHSVGGWNMVGVVQRMQDVEFTLCLPVYDSSYSPSATHLIPLRLCCSIYYNPANDNCLFVNKSYIDIYLTGVGSPESRNCLSYHQTQMIKPGMWRILVKADDNAHTQRVVDFLLLRRQFTVTIHNSQTTATKRLASEEERGVVKRRKWEGDRTEILAATADPLHKPSGVIVRKADAPFETYPTTPHEIIHAGATTLVDLLDGEFASVSVRTPEGINLSSQVALNNRITSPSNTTTYRLSRLCRIADTSSASVFTSRHSALSERVVTKVVRCKRMTPEDLVKCASIWKREKSFLEKIRHENIISLKAFDGRFFAIYVEHLPPSLHRGLKSPLKPSDAYAVLRGTSSALTYLANQQIIHNDIKPANIAYSPTRGPVFLDFGLATSADEKGLPGGTPWYVPPDLIVQRTRGTPGDIWALGVTMLYVMGKINLPEKTTKGWLIRNVMNREGEARKRLMIWLDVVARARAKLNRADTVEGLVFKMLETDSNSRIKAIEIAAVLEHEIEVT